MIDICLATYNGEKYIRNQLDSIIKQTYENWHLYIRDDGSLDNTFYIIKEYKNRYKDKITIIKDEKGRLGCIQNFNEILKYTKANYLAFCDQDDIWCEDKLEKQIKLMEEEEKKSKKGILIYTDFSYIDKNKNVLLVSNYKTRNKNHKVYNSNIIYALFFGNAVGCTMFFNRKLLNLSGNIPEEYDLGHDKWFLYIAILNGRVCFLDKVMVFHRVHEKNMGGKKLKKINISGKKIINKNFIHKRVRTAFILNKYKINSEKIPNKEIHLVRKLSKLEELSFMKRNEFYFKSNLFKLPFIYSVYLYINIIFYNKF